MRYRLDIVMMSLMLLLAGCHSEETENAGERETGKNSVQLGLCIGTSPLKSSGTTRQGDPVTQAAGTIASFRGITDLTLVPFQKPESEISGTEMPLTDMMNLGDLTPSDLLTNSSGHLFYMDEIAKNIQSFVVYGKATQTTTDATIHEINKEYGKLNVSGLTELTTSRSINSISATLTPIEAETAETNTVRDKLINYLNLIANAKDGTDQKWSDLRPTESELGKLYTEFLQMKSGSSANVKAMVQTLYTNLSENTYTETTIQAAIMSAITTSGYATADDNTLDFDSSLDGYPAFHPKGAAQVNWNTTSEQFEAIDINASSIGSTSEGVNSYYYPPSLWYFGRSDLYTSSAPMSGFYTDENNWLTIINQYENKNQPATDESTSSIVLNTPIQYAVGLLQTEVKLGSVGQNQLVDNKENPITFTSGIPLKGILISGLLPVDWQFQPQSNGTPMTIYDSSIPEGINVTYSGYTTPVSTLVLESQSSMVVPIVLELENNSGRDFFGHENQMIPAGSRFYLIGEINNDSEAFDSQQRQVFRRGYLTPVQLTIKSLRHAYCAIPDLRKGQLYTSFTANVDWQRGLSKDFEIKDE